MKIYECVLHNSIKHFKYGIIGWLNSHTKINVKTGLQLLFLLNEY